MNLVGGELRRQRESKSLSQDQLAGVCQRMGWDISRETISRMENQSRLVTDYEIHLLALALGSTAQDLLPANPDLSAFLPQENPSLEKNP